MFNFFLIAAMCVLLVLVFLPFWLVSPGVSKDHKIIKEILPPGTRRYTVILPDGYSAKQVFPLIISLHYSGHGMPFYGEFFLRDLVEPAFRSLNAIFLAPDCPATDWTQEASERFIGDLIRFARENYPIDPSRILIIGFSMGGIGVWHFISRYRDVFSAAVVMAAKPPDTMPDGNWDLPVFVVHGKKDELFPVVNTTKFILQLENSGMDVTYRILEGVSHYETHRFSPVLQEAKTWLSNRWGD